MKKTIVINEPAATGIRSSLVGSMADDWLKDKERITELERALAEIVACYDAHDARSGETSEVLLSRAAAIAINALRRGV